MSERGEGVWILVVEDRASLRRMVERALGQKGHRVVAVADGEAAIAQLEARGFDLVLTDLKLPGASGLDVLKACRASQPDTPVVVLTAYGTVSAAVEAMKHGAMDFLEKPVELDELERIVEGIGGGEPGVDRFQAPGCPPIVGSHPRLLAALRLLRRVAATGTTVLLTGESGTGKELFARALHSLSGRSGGPFVAVNCAAIPELLMENELFGHEKGAFTGAHKTSQGRFERARGGTLFLDEIGELGLGVQAKILRAIEERVFERVGGSEVRRADVRLVAATNRDLGVMVDGGEFRSDLYFRLDVFPIHLPALRDRGDDVVVLLRHLLGEIAARHGVEPPAPTTGAERLLASQEWPGNVRQLANVLERGVILHHGERLTATAVEGLLAHGAGGADGGERDRVRAALERAKGDKRQAAELLDVSYRTLQRKVKEYDLEGYPLYRS